MYLSIILSAFFLASCQQNERSAASLSDNEKIEFKNISNQINESEFFVGDVIIKNYNDQDIVIYVKPKGSKNVKKAYLIQRDQEVINVQDNELKNVLISSNPWGVIIKSFDQIYVFELNNEAGMQVAEKFKNNLSKVNVFEVKAEGIARHRNDWDWGKITKGDKKESALMAIINNSQDLSRKYERLENKRGRNCTSGGVGATSCSISEYFGAVSCDVSCTGTNSKGERYWACCMSSTTTCICVTENDING